MKINNLRKITKILLKLIQFLLILNLKTINLLTTFFFKKISIFINKSPISILFYIFHCLKIIFNSFKKIILIKKYANEILDGPKKKNKKKIPQKK